LTTGNNESSYDLSVTDAASFDDITDKVDSFEFKESKLRYCAWITIDGKKSGLLQKREIPRNKVYAIKITDDKKNEIFRMMEVADDSVDGEPIFLR